MKIKKFQKHSKEKGKDNFLKSLSAIHTRVQMPVQYPASQSQGARHLRPQVHSTPLIKAVLQIPQNSIYSFVFSSKQMTLCKGVEGSSNLHGVW